MPRLKQALIQIDRTDTDPTTKVGSADLLTGQAQHSLLFDHLDDAELVINLQVICNAQDWDINVIHELFTEIFHVIKARLSDE